MTSVPTIRRLLFPVALVAMATTNTVGAQGDTSSAKADPRIGLRGGWNDAAEAARNLQLIAHRPKPEGWFRADSMGDINYWNSDMAFKGNYVFLGGYYGVQIWDISNAASPTLRAKLLCPGGQGDVSVYRNLLFLSAQETRARIDCGTQGAPDTVSAERFRGVRIFDIGDMDHPKQVAAVQTCRGSHTHTLVTDPKDPANVYIYVSGTSVVRPDAELAGCSGRPPEEDPNTALFRIDVIRVPLARPQDARIIANPRLFTDSAGAIAGLAKGDTLDKEHHHSETSRCHDITIYPALSLAAGACAGNGILLDIRDPVNPKRIAEVSDPNFSFWHSATFSNDGRKVLFTDEWGGGGLPKCRATDNPKWGADAIFTLTGKTLNPAGYYKLPVVQTDTENCVAHNGSIIPVPGRDIMVQAWYQGGVSVFDFTDASHPVEIAFFDRGPADSTSLFVVGYWSTYWYNGHIYGTEMGRGLDVFDLKPSEYLSQNEIDAAKLVHADLFNPQNQPKAVWPASFVVARAYLDQLMRDKGIPSARSTVVARDLGRAEKMKGAARRTALKQLAAQLDRDARRASDKTRVQALADEVRQLGGVKAASN